MNTKLRILMFDASSTEATRASRALQAGGLEFTLKRVQTQAAFARELQTKPPGLILSDHAPPKIDGVKAANLAHEKLPEIPFIFFARTPRRERIVDHPKYGVTDFVSQTRPAELAPTVLRRLREQEEKTRRAHAEEAFRKSEELLRLLIEQVTDYAIYVLDAQGRVASWNIGAERLTGFRAEEVVGQTMNHCFTPEEISRGKPMLQLFQAATKGRIEAESWCRRKDGSRYYAYYVITAIRDAAGKPAGFLNVARDITARKQHEEEAARWNAVLEQRVKERTAQLEAANRELESFSYSVSHDLRAPLRHIDGFVEILQSAAAPRLDQDSRDHLKTIAESARQMGKLIDDLLTFSRLARARVNKCRVNLADAVREAMRPLKRESEGRDVEWVVGELPDVQADPGLLRQALINLIGNALKYTRTRKRARIEIGATSSLEEITFFIQDNGVGFDMRYADKLFGVFQRLHRASEFEGTGIGLANVRRIIHRQGGRTWAKGTLNRGATFYFSLPTGAENAS